MKRVCVFLFSGTGMTRYIARKLSSALEERQAQVDVFEIEKPQSREVPVQGYDIIGIAYPVHSLNAPKKVVDFVKGLPETERKEAFVISTAGGDSKLNSASRDLPIGILRKKGFLPYYEKEFLMPSNFIVKDDVKAVEEKLEKAGLEIPKAADDILDGVANKGKAGFLAKLASFAGRAEWLGTKLVRLHADSKCDGCGLCAARCPNQNIRVEAGAAAFNRNCGLCMRCLYLCPKHAARIRFPLRFFAFGEWYDNDGLRL